jgi:hypothetical protein
MTTQWNPQSIRSSPIQQSTSDTSCHMYEWLTVDGVWIGNSIYLTLANSHNLQFTTSHTKSSQSPVPLPVDISLLLGSRPRRLAAISHQPNLLTAISRLKTLFLMANGPRYIALAGTTQRTPPPTGLTLLRPLSSNGCCLQSHYLPVAVVWLLISWLLPSNWSACHNIVVSHIRAFPYYNLVYSIYHAYSVYIQ